MRVFAGAVVFVFFIQSNVISKRLKTKTIFRGGNGILSDDPVLEVEPLPPDVVRGDCNCVCCEPPPEPLRQPKCANDVVIAVDSSACFRDHHSRMMRFLKKLVRRIGRTDNIQYGGDETRLALMQFSSDIVFPLELSSFEDYTNPSTRKGIMDGINTQLERLRFLGEGSFLNKALNATVDHIQTQPRPQRLLDAISPTNPRPIVIVITNGKSHPTVTMNDIEYSITDLQRAGVTVIPVSVTRECHGVQSDGWNEGLCPDTIVLNKLAKIGRPDTSTFMEMTSLETMADIINVLEACYPKASGYTGNYCNNCTCSCELPVGPRGPSGPKGPPGDFVEGPQGKKGEVGPKGSPGFDGPQGKKGDKGSFGDKGNVGPKGDKGVVGPEGGKGMIGLKGNVGDKGEFGEPGLPGSRGRKGDDGEKGMIGPKGEVGDKGEVGSKGSPGETGDEGKIGPKGEKGKGERGEPGVPGPRGPSGKPGDEGKGGPKGMPGPPGLCGKPGPAGKPGIEGIGGVNGVDGLPGPPGIQGPRGERGEDGDKGERGDVGLPGSDGRRGLPGERGPSGPQGGRGEKGGKGEPSNELGPQGNPGERGRKGERGRNGIDGLNGPEGRSGRQGPRGEQGPKGPPGEFDVEYLRPIISDIIRELLPGNCATPPDPIVEPSCQESGIDLAFLVDGSDSIDREDFDRIKNWILLTVDAFHPAVREISPFVFVVQFSERSELELSQMVFNNSEEISRKVYAIEQMRSGTKTYSALQFVNQVVYPTMRSNAIKILITMTDGDASEDRNVAAIKAAQRNYDMMVAVGVGSKVINEELQDFSTRGNVFNVDNFGVLEGIISTIVENICSEEQEEPSPPVVPTPRPSPILPVAPGCYRTMTDLAFVMDGSASVGEDGFVFLQNFLTNAISEFQTVGSDGVQIGMIQYNAEPKLELNFEECTSKDVALDTVDNLKYLSGNTRTGLALEFLGQLYDNINQPSRPNAKRVAVVITDGRSQDDVKNYALDLRNKGVVIFAIGVGEAEYVELVEIASTPTANYVYNVAEYAAISSIKDSLVERICRDIEGIYKAPGTDIEEGLFPVGGEEDVTEEGAEPDVYDGGSGSTFDKELP